jgi:hypothetical protein
MIEGNEERCSFFPLSRFEKAHVIDRRLCEAKYQ